LDCIVCELRENIDSLVTVFLTCKCVTGILVGVSDDACKIICHGGRQNRPGITICRISDIQAVTLCNTSR
jgi:hypothetical protein